MNIKELKSLIIAVAEGLKSTDLEVVESTLINTIREAMEVSVEHVTIEKVVEVEVPVEKEVVKEVTVTVEKVVEVIPEDIQETLDDNESYINELETELKAVLADVEALKERCTELHNQNEELLKALEEQPEDEQEPEQVTFEEPKPVSNEDILTNNTDDDSLEDFELEQEQPVELTFDEPVQEPKPVQRKSRNKGFTKAIDLEEQEQEQPVYQPKKERLTTNRNQFNGQSRRKRNTGFSSIQDNSPVAEFKKYLNMINAGELTADNISDNEMQRIIDICHEVNNNQLPNVVADLYSEYLNRKEC